jgi:hypothetical protein
MLRRVLAVAVFISTLATQAVYAQHSSSSQARELLSSLQDTRSMVKVGINAIDYARVARDLQISVDRFLRTPGARQHPAGGLLKKAAERYIEANDHFESKTSSSSHLSELYSSLIQSSWSLAKLDLELAEKCITTGKSCESIEQQEFRLAQAEQKRLQLAKQYKYCLKISDPKITLSSYGRDTVKFGVTNNCNVTIKSAKFSVSSVTDSSTSYVHDLKTNDYKEDSTYLEASSGVSLVLLEVSIDQQ